MRYYVYRYSYEDDTPFYFGKGCKNRASEHARVSNSNNRTTNLVIRDIITHGQVVNVKILKYFRLPIDALLYENELIQQYSDTLLLTNITNNTCGHSIEKHYEKLGMLTEPKETKAKKQKINKKQQQLTRLLELLREQYQLEVFNITDVDLLIAMSRRTLLLSPGGNIYDETQNIDRFCQRNDLDRNMIVRLLAGKIHNYEGWKVY